MQILLSIFISLISLWASIFYHTQNVWTIYAFQVWLRVGSKWWNDVSKNWDLLPKSLSPLSHDCNQDCRWNSNRRASKVHARHRRDDGIIVHVPRIKSKYMMSKLIYIWNILFTEIIVYFLGRVQECHMRNSHAFRQEEFI